MSTGYPDAPICTVAITLYHPKAQVVEHTVLSHPDSNSFTSFQDLLMLDPILTPGPGTETLEEDSQARGL